MANIITAHPQPNHESASRIGVEEESSSEHGARMATTKLPSRGVGRLALTFWKCLTFNSVGNCVRRSFLLSYK